MLVTINFISYHIYMKLKRTHIINSLSILILGLIFLSDAMVFIKFHQNDKCSCCATECHCNTDDDCEMSIDCGPTHVVLMIPLVNINKYELDSYESSDFFSENLDLDFSNKENRIFQPQINPILKPPLHSLNTPLLI